MATRKRTHRVDIQPNTVNSLLEEVLPQAENLHYFTKSFPEENHGTVIIPGIYDGIKQFIRKMKKLFAKIHLWLSRPFGIIISILCLTGALLIFETELKELFQPSIYKASMARETPLAIEELMPIVKQQLPDSIAISSVQIPVSLKDNYRMGMTGQGRTSLLVDPYTGEIKGRVTPYEKGNFFSFVRRLHRWFLIQNSREGISWGKMVTGTSTLVFAFILITGIIIWVPKTVKSLKRKLKIKVGSGNFRFWYDTHLAGGMYVVILLLVMALTGLTWSFDWYRKGFYKVFGVEITQNAGHGQAAQQTQAPQQTAGNLEGGRNPHEVNAATGGREEKTGRAEGRGERPQRSDSEDGEGRQGRGQHFSQDEEGKPRGERPERGERPQHNEGENGEGRPQREGNPQYAAGTSQEGAQRQGREGNYQRGNRNQDVDYAVWTKVVSSLKATVPSYKSISVQNGTASVSINNTGNTRASDRYTFDPKDGTITDVQYYKDQPKSAKMRGWIYSVHVGSWGGLLTRILYFIACIIGATLPYSGYYIYIKKRWKKSKSRRNRKVELTNAS